MCYDQLVVASLTIFLKLCYVAVPLKPDLQDEVSTLNVLLLAGHYVDGRSYRSEARECLAVTSALRGQAKVLLSSNWWNHAIEGWRVGAATLNPTPQRKRAAWLRKLTRIRAVLLQSGNARAERYGGVPSRTPFFRGNIGVTELAWYAGLWLEHNEA